MVGRKERKGKEARKGRNPIASVRCAEIENGAPRNSALSTSQSEISEENGASFSDREVLISMTVFRQSEWGNIILGLDSAIGDRSCVIDTVFNGGALCSFNWARKYTRYS